MRTDDSQSVQFVADADVGAKVKLLPVKVGADGSVSIDGRRLQSVGVEADADAGMKLPKLVVVDARVDADIKGRKLQGAGRQAKASFQSESEVVFLVLFAG